MTYHAASIRVTPGALRTTGLCALALWLSGCVAPGRVEFAPLDFSAIDPPAARFAHVTLERCYWWTDAHDQVWIAMECDQPVLLGQMELTFRMSLVLERLPAGHARNYQVRERELRAAVRLGPAEGRYVSLRGIVALYREPGDRLRGSFRLDTAREISRLLGGWGKPSRHLMQGSFVAIRDARRGRRIAEQTEVPGWEREPPPLDRTATQPASAPVNLP